MTHPNHKIIPLDSFEGIPVGQISDLGDRRLVDALGDRSRGLWDLIRLSSGLVVGRAMRIPIAGYRGATAGILAALPQQFLNLGGARCRLTEAGETPGKVNRWGDMYRQTHIGWNVDYEFLEVQSTSELVVYNSFRSDRNGGIWQSGHGDTCLTWKQIGEHEWVILARHSEGPPLPAMDSLRATFKLHPQ